MIYKRYCFFCSSDSLAKQLISHRNEVDYCNKLWEVHKNSYLSRHQISWLWDKRVYHQTRINIVQKMLDKRNKTMK